MTSSPTPAAERPTAGRQFLSARDIFGADDLEERDVYVPQWKGYVRIRALTDDQRTRVTAQATIPGTTEINQTALMRYLVIASVIDGDGHQVFEPKDHDALGRKSTMAIATIFAAINDLNKLGEGAVADAAESFPGESAAPTEVPAGAAAGPDGA